MALLLYKWIKAKRQPAAPHANEPSPTLLEEHQLQRSSNSKLRWKLMLCLAFPYALQSLDSTIIASAMPWIAQDFNKVSEENWIVSAFTLTSAAFIPFWAQMADVFGRNASIIAATVIMLVGSGMCTGAPTTDGGFGLLLFGRSLQGIAASGLNVLVRTILTDGFSLQESAQNWSTFAFVGGLAYGFGPVIGGYLTRANWRWCFGINLPIAAVALLIIVFLLRKHLLGPQPLPELDESTQTGRRSRFITRLKTIDVGGQVLFIVGLGLIVLGLTWGGAAYSWSSPAVLVPLAAGVVMTAFFALWERQLSPGRSLSKKLPLQKAMIPWSIITTRDMGLLFYTECASGMAMFSVLYFCNVYFIAVKNYTSDKAGLQLLYFIPGMAGGIIICSFMCGTWPRMSFPPLFLGSLIEMIGLGALSWAMYHAHEPTIFGMMALVGFGIGMRFMVSPMHGIGLFKQHRATIIGLMAVAIPLGGTIGLTVMSSIFNNSSGLDANNSDFSKLHDLPAQDMETVIHKVKMAVVWAYVGLVPFVLIAFVCTMFIGNVIMGSKGNDSPELSVSEPYLWYLFKGGKMMYPEEDLGIRLGSSDQRSAKRDTLRDMA